MGSTVFWGRAKPWRGPWAQCCALWWAGWCCGRCAAAGAMRTWTGVRCLPVDCPCPDCCCCSCRALLTTLAFPSLPIWVSHREGLCGIRRWHLEDDHVAGQTHAHDGGVIFERRSLGYPSLRSLLLQIVKGIGSRGAARAWQNTLAGRHEGGHHREVRRRCVLEHASGCCGFLHVGSHNHPARQHIPAPAPLCYAAGVNCS